MGNKETIVPSFLVNSGESEARRHTQLEQKFLHAVEGWESCSESELLLIPAKVSQYLTQITFGDIYEYFGEPVVERVYRDDLEREIELAVLNLGSETFRMLPKEVPAPIEKVGEFCHNSINAMSNQYMPTNWALVLRKIDLSTIFESWLKAGLKNASPENAARAVFIATESKNSLLEINGDSRKIAAKMLKFMDNRALPLPESAQSMTKEEIVERIAYALNEALYAVSNYVGGINAWTYASSTMYEILKAIANHINIPSGLFPHAITKEYLIIQDFINFALTGLGLPAQWAGAILKLHADFGEKIYSNGINFDKIYRNAIPGETIHSYLKGRQTYVVTGLNRPHEDLPTMQEQLKRQPGIVLDLFCGPVDVSAYQSDLAGAKMVLSVDGLPKSELQDIRKGGRALIIGNEHLDSGYVWNAATSPPESQILQEFEQASLPQEWPKVTKAAEGRKISLILDKRGGGLYLNGQAKLQHLRQVYVLLAKNPGGMYIFDSGVPVGLYSKLVTTATAEGFEVHDSFLTIGNKSLVADYEQTDLFPISNFQKLLDTYGIRSVPPRFSTENLYYAFYLFFFNIHELKPGIQIENRAAATMINNLFRYILYWPKLLAPELSIEEKFRVLKTTLSDSVQQYNIFETVLWPKEVREIAGYVAQNISYQALSNIISEMARYFNVTVSRQGIFYPDKIYSQLQRRLLRD